jgi:hypothetical protein
MTVDACKRDPYKPNFEHAGGYVIGKEICMLNPDDDEWLIDLSYNFNPPNLNYGDTLTIDGVKYEHMVKTKQLPIQFRVVGKAVSFDFTLSTSAIESTNCSVTTPRVYRLKEMSVIASGEIR